MSTIMRFEDIQAWQTARELTRLVYRLSDQGKFAKDFGLRDQIRRAAVSVMSNIAEGFESASQAQFFRYLGMAKGSAVEVRSQAYVALDLEYISQDESKELLDLADKNIRQIARFIIYLEAHPESRRIREEMAEYDV